MIVQRYNLQFQTKMFSFLLIKAQDVFANLDTSGRMAAVYSIASKYLRIPLIQMALLPACVTIPSSGIILVKHVNVLLIQFLTGMPHLNVNVISITIEIQLLEDVCQIVQDHKSMLIH